MVENRLREIREFWDAHARTDPLWAILADAAKKGRKWNIRDFFETGRREISVLLFRLKSLGLSPTLGHALDFGCGIGRLTRALAPYFERVVGVDVSPAMIELAEKLNIFPAKVRYVSNPVDHLHLFGTGEFDFIYSSIVLQHIQPEMTLGYFSEFLRVLKPGGLLVFQLPSHRRETLLRPEEIGPMGDEAYRSRLQVEGVPLAPQPPSKELVMKVFIKNVSSDDWVQKEAAPLRAGNHWLSGDGTTMFIQDDGRAALPRVIKAGEECLVYLKLTTPPQPGDYLCEIDLVHESVSWFKDKGGSSLRFPLRVRARTADISAAERIDQPDNASESDSLREAATDQIRLELPDMSRDPGNFPMFGIPREQVVAFFRSKGTELLRVEDDDHGAPEWAGYLYIVRKNQI